LGDTTNGWTALASDSTGTKLYAAGFSSNIYISSDSGVNWTSSTTTSASWRAIASSTDGTKLIAGQYNGRLYFSSNSGSTFT
ncbi:MAG: hypothetical protein AAB664_03375, partial [Patescibacteria group bacterium]